MSSLWRQAQRAAGTRPGWERIPWQSSPLRLPVAACELLLARFGAGNEAAVALLASPGSGACVNGLPLLGGLKVLSHRDEIVAGGERFVFSEESLPQVTVFHARRKETSSRRSKAESPDSIGGDSGAKRGSGAKSNSEPGQREARCSLCRGAIQEGMAIVECPRCMRLFHQIDAGPDGPEKHCWTYSEKCRHCEHPTALSGEVLWSPEQEGRDEQA
jgi:hypothetical protein